MIYRGLILPELCSNCRVDFARVQESSVRWPSCRVIEHLGEGWRGEALEIGAHKSTGQLGGVQSCIVEDLARNEREHIEIRVYSDLNRFLSVTIIYSSSGNN